MEEQNDHITHQMNEPEILYKGFFHQTEEEKLLKDVLRSDLEKLQLFTKMLRRNTTLKKAVISNNPPY